MPTIILDGTLLDHSLASPGTGALSSGESPLKRRRVEQGADPDVIQQDEGSLSLSQMLEEKEASLDSSDALPIDITPSPEHDSPSWQSNIGSYLRGALSLLRSLGIVTAVSTASTSPLVRRVGLAIETEALSHYAGRWDTRNALLLWGMALPCRRLQLWLDTAFAYVASPGVRHLLSEQELARIEAYRALPDWARSAIGMCSLFSLLPVQVLNESRNPIIGLRQAVRKRVALSMSPTARLGELDGWLVQVAEDGLLPMGRDRRHPLLLVSHWSLTQAATDIITDAARLMLGYGAGYDSQIQSLSCMILGLTGLGRYPAASLAHSPWAFFESREWWLKYKSSMQWLGSLRTAAVLAAEAVQTWRGAEKAGASESAAVKSVARKSAIQRLKLLRSVLAHCVTRRCHSEETHERVLEPYAWQSRTGHSDGAVHNGPPALRLEVSIARALEAPSSSAPAFLFDMPLGSVVCFPERRKSFAEMSNPVSIYSYGVWIAATVFMFAASYASDCKTLTVENVTAAGRQFNDILNIDDLACEAARLFWFVVQIPFPSHAVGCHNVQRQSLIFLADLFTNSKSWASLRWFCESIPDHLKDNILRSQIQVWISKADKRGAYTESQTPMRAASGSHIVHVNVVLSHSGDAERTLFISPLAESCVDETEESHMKAGKTRVLYPISDRFCVNVERMLCNEVVRDAVFRNKVLQAIAVNKCIRTTFSGRSVATLKNSVVMPTHLVPNFVQEMSLSTLLPNPRHPDRLYQCDDNICAETKSRTWRAVHCENQLLPVISACLVWPAICEGFAVWKHPFAAFPVSWTVSDALQVVGGLALDKYCTLSRCAFSALMVENFRSVSGSQVLRARWDLIDEQTVRFFSHAAGPLAVRALCERLLSDTQSYSTGLPDVVLFKLDPCTGSCEASDGGEYAFLEVKSDTDSARPHQEDWLEYMQRKGIPSAIVHFTDNPRCLCPRCPEMRLR